MSKKSEHQGNPSGDRRGDAPQPSSAPVPAQRWLRVIGIVEWCIFATICLLVVWFQAVLYEYAGSFWRDEASSILLSHSPGFCAMWRQLGNDSFPGLFVTLLRCWNESGLGATGGGLRLFGTLVDLGIVASLSISCFSMTRRPPLLALALVGLNGSVFYFGSSIRAYGLGALLIVGCFAAFWRVVRQPTKWNVAAAFLLALLSAHANYQNCYLLFGIGAGGAMACAACRLWKRGVLLLAICFVVAVTMLVYLPAIRAYGDSAIVTQFEVGLDLVMAKLGEALAGASPLLLAAWIALAAIAVVSMIVHVIDNWRATDANARLPSLELYCLATGLIALTVGFAFFQANGMYPFPWHFIPFITLAGVIVEVGIRSTTRANWISVARIAAAAVIVAMSVLPIWKQAHLRRTNLDLLCHTLEREAGPDDRIILMRFWLAPGFGWQYHGSTPWEMIPAIPMSDEAVMAPGHFQKQAMLNPDVLDPTLESIQKTLASGHRVWLVGDVQFLPPNARPPKLEPPPHPKYGWNNNVYGQAWSMQVAYFLQTHADRADSVPVQVDQPISRIEDMPLWVVNGWRR